VDTLRRHWPEYLIEGWALGMFMISAGVVTTLFESTRSPLRAALPDADLRRVLIGLCMGLTAIALIHSRWGQRSGAHMNPAVTLTFWRLGRIRGPDALFYMCAQFVGGTLGVLLVHALLGPSFSEPAVNWVATVPGPSGAGPAFIGELLISFALMAVILAAGSHPRVEPWTGVLAGGLVALWIAIEAPLSGMSMNPARSFASAAPAGVWSGFWIYCTAPVLGMLAAAALLRRLGQPLPCAKLRHAADMPCIHCGYTPPCSGERR
jgi:aquaporin Z